MNNSRVTIDISLSSILKVFAVLLGLWFFYLIRDILMLLFLVIIIVMALDPIVYKWQKRMSRPVAVGLLFLIIMAFVALAISILIPPLVSQISELANNLPTYTSQLQTLSFNLSQTQNEGLAFTQKFLEGISSQLSGLSRGFINTTLGILGGVVTAFTVIVLSAYLLLEEKGIKKFIVSLLPFENRENMYKAINKVGDKLGAWLRGQLLLMLLIGLLATLWATILGVPYALTLGLWAGLTEIIPFLGPILGGIPFLLLALHISPLTAIIALILLVITQQVESNFLVPKIMQRSLGLSPVIVIIALLIGTKLFGMTGTILSVPAAATLMVVIEEWPKWAKLKA